MDAPPFADLDTPVAGLVRAHPWSDTAFGPIAQWPEDLVALVGVILRSRFPMLLALGPELDCLYNDGCLPLLDDKHPEPSAGRCPRSGRTVGPSWPPSSPSRWPAGTSPARNG